MNNSKLFAVSRDKKRAKEIFNNEQQGDKKPSAQELEQHEIDYARLGFNEPIER